jgi:hypothetical protein
MSSQPEEVKTMSMEHKSESAESGIYVIRESPDANAESGLLAKITARFERWRHRKTAENSGSTKDAATDTLPTRSKPNKS